LRAALFATAALVLAACVALSLNVSAQPVGSEKPRNCGYITPELPAGVQRLETASPSSQKFANFLGYREGVWTSSGRGLNLCTTLNVLTVTEAGEVNAVYCNGADAERSYSLICVRLPGQIKDGKLTIYPYDTRPFTYEYRPDGSLQGTFSSQSGNRRSATLTPR
jgi:hypothetical protein